MRTIVPGPPRQGHSQRGKGGYCPPPRNIFNYHQSIGAYLSCSLSFARLGVGRQRLTQWGHRAMALRSYPPFDYSINKIKAFCIKCSLKIMCPTDDGPLYLSLLLVIIVIIVYFRLEVYKNKRKKHNTVHSHVCKN